jgi:hypothetical protein
VVLKPLALSASRGVMRADDEAAFVSAFERIRRLLRSPDVRSEPDPAHDQVLIESFIPGDEVAIEGVLTRGAFQPLALFDKPDPLEGPFFEETLYVRPSRRTAAEQQAIVGQVAAAARAIGLWHGPVHAECRMGPDGVYVLEAAARPIGGLCAKAVRLASAHGEAMTLEELLLRHACGEDVSGWREAEGASGVMMIPIPRRGVYRGADGLDAAMRVDGIEEIRIVAKPDSAIVPLPEGRSYLGFIFASGHRPAVVERALREAHGRIRFRIDRDVAVVVP